MCRSCLPQRQNFPYLSSSSTTTLAWQESPTLAPQYSFVYLKGRVAEGEGETQRDIAFPGSLPRWLPWPGLGWAEARSRELHLGLSGSGLSCYATTLAPGIALDSGFSPEFLTCILGEDVLWPQPSTHLSRAKPRVSDIERMKLE